MENFFLINDNKIWTWLEYTYFLKQLGEKIKLSREYFECHPIPAIFWDSMSKKADWSEVGTMLSLSVTTLSCHWSGWNISRGSSWWMPAAALGWRGASPMGCAMAPHNGKIGWEFIAELAKVAVADPACRMPSSQPALSCSGLKGHTTRCYRKTNLAFCSHTSHPSSPITGQGMWSTLPPKELALILGGRLQEFNAIF